MKRILVNGPKGGVGKTTLSRNLAVAAALDGLDVATLDLDPQRSLTKWFGKREDDMASISHFEANMAPVDVREAISGISGFDLVVIDTPPSIEDHPEEFKLLALAADIVLIPTGQSDDDLDSVRPWMRFVRRYGVNAAFILNRVKPRTRAFTEAQRLLLADGRVCPVEIPDYDDIQFTARRGLGVLEVKGAKGIDHMAGVWAFVRQEIGR